MSSLALSVRNQAISSILDTWSFAKNHPYLSVITLGIAPVLYSCAQRFIELASAVDNLSRKIIGITPGPIKHLDAKKEAVQSKTDKKTWSFPFALPTGLNLRIQRALYRSPAFQGYKIKLPEGHICHDISDVLNVSLRPANLWLRSLFNGSSIDVIPPNIEGKLFAYNCPQKKVADFIDQNIRSNPNKNFAMSAKGVPGHVGSNHMEDLSEIYGSATYEMSYKEVTDIIDSQTVFLSSLLPKTFYLGLKEAMLKDGIVILPDIRLDEVQSLHTYLFLKEVAKDPLKFGFKDSNHFATFKELSLYQIGSMVVKSQNFHVISDGNGKIRERKANTKDEICLIDACGLRDFHYRKNLTSSAKTQIMLETFKAALRAASSGMLLIPAIGMGVWKGDPEIYWFALLEAIATTNTDVEKIFVNPAHGKTLYGKHTGLTGEEFQKMLDDRFASSTLEEQERLKKVYNLLNAKKDVVQLAHELKTEFPNKKISLINASDPDVTLGFHVGEYTNNLTNNHPPTTEEHYAAIGTNSLCFEGITRVCKHSDTRVRQMLTNGECA